MNVGELKRLIADIPDNVEMFRICGDHQAMSVDTIDWFIDYQPLGNYQFFSDEDMFEGSEKVRALVIE